MSFGELAAVTLQTALILVFIALLIPFRFSIKKTAVILGCYGLVLCAVAAGITAWQDVSFLASYGFAVVSVPLFVCFRLLSKAKGVRFLFVAFTAVLFHQMVSTLLSAFRIQMGGGYTPLYLLMNVFAFGLLLAGAGFIRRDFHKIVATYRYEFVCLTLILVLLFGMIMLFDPINASRTALDPDLFLIVLGIDVLVVLLYLYIGVSFHSLSKLCDETREATALRLQIEEAQNHIGLLSVTQERADFYRHDLHRHITLIQGFLDRGETEQLRAYLQGVQAGMDNDMPQRYCQNEAANLLLIALSAKASAAGVRLLADACLPLSLPIGDPELCTLLSNALENAITAAAAVKIPAGRTVCLTARVADGKLLLQVRNPYVGTVRMENGLPTRNPPNGHGLGVASMVSIVKKYGGLSSFEAADGVFVLRIVI